jgi:hypothetical protein
MTSNEDFGVRMYIVVENSAKWGPSACGVFATEKDATDAITNMLADLWQELRDDEEMPECESDAMEELRTWYEVTTVRVRRADFDAAEKIGAVE